MENTTPQSSIDTLTTLSALMVIGTLGISIFMILPAIAIAMMEDLGRSEQQVGVVGFAGLIGIACGSILNLVLVKRLALRRLAYLGLLGMLMVDFGTLFVDSHNLFVATRFVSGLAGGIAVSFAAYALGKTSQADRNFGWFLVIQVSFGILALLALPRIITAFGIDGVFATLCIIHLMALLFLAPMIPNILPSNERGASGTNSALIWKFCATVLLAVLCFYMAIGGFWTYIGPIGIDAGLSREATSTALGVGLGGGLGGAYAAAALNIRFGRIPPVVCAIGLQLTALLILSSGFGLTSFTVAAVIFSFGWYMYFPYMMGLLAALDRDGRSIVIANVCAGAGSGLGPLFAAAFLSDGFAPTYIICFAFLVASASFTIATAALSRRHLKGTST